MSDLMLHGVLNMPLADDPAELDLLTWVQFRDRAREASARIQSDAARIAELEEMAMKYLSDAGQFCDLISERDALRAENERLKEQVVAYAGSWAVQYAHDRGLPEGHLHPTHYDDLANAGARMVSFTRAALDTKGGA